MKNKLLLFLTLCLMCVGCESGRTEQPQAKYWHVITIDGCQYLENSQWNDVPLTHKANCNNPIHKK